MSFLKAGIGAKKKTFDVAQILSPRNAQVLIRESSRGIIMRNT